MATEMTKLFRPGPGNTKVVTVSATATTVAFLGGGPNFRIANDSGGLIYFQLGGSTVSATVSDCVMLASTVEVFERDPAVDTHISVRTASGAGTGSVYIETGTGE